MSAYVIIRIMVNDPVKLKDYQQVAPSIIESFGGKLLVRGGKVASLEGSVENRRIVIIEFPSLEQAKNFYHSSEYTEAIELRKGAAEFELIAVEGLG
ncbi:DUF1330 domain-containing protein [Mariprofundus ferrooxydans]|nr:DUF1330 domain-containing protein [Mariprofundus ferrooxydans]